MPEDLFLFNITHLDERSVEVSWKVVHDLVVGYKVMLLLEDGTIVGEQTVNETRAFFEELKAFTTHVLVVEALVSNLLKLPLVSNISFRTGMCRSVADCLYHLHTHDVICVQLMR